MPSIHIHHSPTQQADVLKRLFAGEKVDAIAAAVGVSAKSVEFALFFADAKVRRVRADTIRDNERRTIQIRKTKERIELYESRLTSAREYLRRLEAEADALRAACDE